MTNKNYSNVPVFENGMAQPVFPFTDGKTGEKYDPNTSSIVRYCVYVESDYDTVSYTHLTLPTTSGWCRSRWSPYH